MPELPIYLDNNATTPCDPRVLEAMMPYFTSVFGNAASRHHSFGWKAEDAVDVARQQVASLIGAEPQEIVFTSGATEANNLAIKGVFEMYAGKGNHMITTRIEHKAVLDTCTHIEKLGGEVTYISVDKNGRVNLEELEAAIRPGTILIAVMYANNETGTVMQVKEVSDIARRHNVLFFTDAAQAIGKIPVNVQRDGIDLLSLSAHKMYGPKGVGALYVRRKNPRVRLTAQMDGGGHERGYRSGTLNVPGIVGLGKAAELCAREMDAEADRLGKLRDKLREALLQLEATTLNGDRVHVLPHVTNISFNYVEGKMLMLGFNRDLAVSSGSACTSASLEPSYVLKALGIPDEQAHSSFRFALGRFTTEEEVDFAIEKVKETVEKLRETSEIWKMYRKGVDLSEIW
ncbi:IscS subfamily cysteine desulfurase [Terrimonas sp. NA20]|uniref:Cysteine desulfurase IscS n=1 Tax=Terrimonas ginsenosidimutans TaxID=2908004 RepID=A0ABS9KQM0_9BACT|nr:IscS subfamily cysteine desulfurase [Terrimonas ginsenosidimutans]MCG2614630.1 IscS subfamily cysteine desulfurase [Terrimonas ginsenosidimutans]